MTAFDPTHRCGTVPDFHRVPSCDAPPGRRCEPTARISVGGLFVSRQSAPENVSLSPVTRRERTGGAEVTVTVCQSALRVRGVRERPRPSRTRTRPAAPADAERPPHTATGRGERLLRAGGVTGGTAPLTLAAVMHATAPPGNPPVVPADFWCGPSRSDRGGTCGAACERTAAGAFARRLVPKRCDVRASAAGASQRALEEPQHARPVELPCRHVLPGVHVVQRVAPRAAVAAVAFLDGCTGRDVHGPGPGARTGQVVAAGGRQVPGGAWGDAPGQDLVDVDGAMDPRRCDPPCTLRPCR